MTSTSPTATTATPTGSTRAGAHELLPAGRAEGWLDAFDHWPTPHLPQLLGARLDEVRLDYARMSLPYRPAHDQPAGVVHGGAIATLRDTVVVPAIGSAYEHPPVALTVDLQVRFLDAARQVDLVAEGWITKRGRSIVFCQSEVTTAAGDVVAEAWLTYRVLSTPVQGATS